MTNANELAPHLPPIRGCPAVDEKWIARIWRHTGMVPPPFGLSSESIETHL